MRGRTAVVLVGVVVAPFVAGCTGAAHPPSAARSTTSSTSGSTTSTSVESTTTTASPSSPGVLANCTAAPPQSLSVEPTSITVACADAGLGAKDLTWQSWTANSASGSGDVWENDCTPNCAEGTIRLYPAAISLSGVKASRDGPAFTVMSATYRNAEPNGHATDTFGLQLPLG